MDFYNEYDPFAAAWLEALIKERVLPPGLVDTRSIEDIHPSDLKGFVRCHFFAGIGVWAYALEQAGWPRDRSVWTGSCPCQPFSAAGKGEGFADERHLWPAFNHLIEVERPGIILGEQVADKNGFVWLDLVQDDMENKGYAFAAVPFGAAALGTPHIRFRSYWVADAEYAERGTEFQEYDYTPGRDGPGRSGDADGAMPTNGFWREADWLGCRDGKWRPVEPGTFPLVDGTANRVGRLRGYGNALVAPQAIEFIRAVMECRPLSS